MSGSILGKIPVLRVSENIKRAQNLCQKMASNASNKGALAFTEVVKKPLWHPSAFGVLLTHADEDTCVFSGSSKSRCDRW